jgi:hypothetical protein
LPAHPRPWFPCGFRRTQILRDGLEVTDIHAGKGAPAAPGDVVKVHYTGKLAKTGKQFDAGTISFKLGAGKVIKGWDQGLQGLRQGGTRMLHVPPSLAYGAKGTPGGPIPGDATLLFSVKLLHVKKARQEGSKEQAIQKHKKLFKKKQAARAAQMKMYSAKLVCVPLLCVLCVCTSIVLCVYSRAHTRTHTHARTHARAHTHT